MTLSSILFQNIFLTNFIYVKKIQIKHSKLLQQQLKKKQQQKLYLFIKNNVNITLCKIG